LFLFLFDLKYPLRKYPSFSPLTKIHTAFLAVCQWHRHRSAPALKAQAAPTDPDRHRTGTTGTDQKKSKFYREFLIYRENQQIVWSNSKVKKYNLLNFYTVKALFKQNSRLIIIAKFKKIIN